jgi:hypothetical protein
MARKASPTLLKERISDFDCHRYRSIWLDPDAA